MCRGSLKKVKKIQTPNVWEQLSNRWDQMGLLGYVSTNHRETLHRRYKTFSNKHLFANHFQTFKTQTFVSVNVLKLLHVRLMFYPYSTEALVEGLLKAIHLPHCDNVPLLFLFKFQTPKMCLLLSTGTIYICVN